MTPSTIDRSELEDRVRHALAARARSTVVGVPDRFALDLRGRPLAPRPSSRVRVVVVAAALVAVVVGLTVLVARHGGTDGATGPPAGPAEETPEPPVPGLPVSGPTGSRWFVLDLPGGLTPGVSSRTPTAAAPGGRPELQAFRTEAGFAGPAVWVEPGAPASGGDGGMEVTVQGEPAFVRDDGDVVRLTTSRGFLLTAAHITPEDLVAFADGLQPRDDGGGWEATVLPVELAEVTEVEQPQPASEHAEWDYTDPDGANYELFVDPGGPAAFESWAREHVSSGHEVAAISVDGRPGLLVVTEGETIAVWRPTDDVVVDFRTSLDRDGLLDAMAVLRPVDEATWIDQFATSPGATGG